MKPNAELQAESATLPWSLEGPIDGSYSLAIVNRELARGLVRAGVKLSLISRDGPGSRPVDPRFLAENPDVAAMLDDRSAPSVVLRNQYPPFVEGMGGAFKAFCNYGWEESGFPQEWIAGFNNSLDAILVPSRFVAKTLRDNGCVVPIAVVGYGADHNQHLDAPVPPKAGAPFQFLHLSSAFPRKGVDALLEAWGLAFTSEDAVELVIKTFPNPHNDVEALLTQMRLRFPDHAPVRLINEERDDTAVRELLHAADAVVCPSRGEGFGLPLAEALFLRKPVVTTAFGGQADFCNESNGWLCDYWFAYSQSHLATFGSVWADPDVGSLAAALTACRSAERSVREQKGRAGREQILETFKWDDVAQRTKAAIEKVVAHKNAKNPAAGRKVGWVSTWNSRCGVADYSRSLSSQFDTNRLIVFADHGAKLLGADDPFVRRAWREGHSDTLDELYASIIGAGVDVVVLQFNFGFFNLAHFARLLDRLAENEIGTYVVLHSTMDVSQPERRASLSMAADSLRKPRRLFVHSVDDLNRLKRFGVVDNVALLPFGLPTLEPTDRDRNRRELGLGGKKVVAVFGYLLPNKGLREIIHAFAMLRMRQSDCHLLMLNALYPIPQSALEYAACLEDIGRFKLGADVSLLTAFRDQRDILRMLNAADLIAYPYQNTQESASAAVRFGLSALRPVACTPLRIFDDVRGVAHTLPGTAPDALADGIARLLGDEQLLNSKLAAQEKMVQQQSWDKISERISGVIEGDARDLAVGFR